MKTSNKILIGLLIVIFAVPLLVSFSLKSKIDKGEYTIEKYENMSTGSMRSGSFTAFKVVKVMAPHPHLLTCHLKFSDTSNYSFYKENGKDSIIVFNSNDTLYVEYSAGEEVSGSNERSDNQHLEIHVDLPAFNNIVVDGAIVIIDSVPATAGNLSVTLRNNGEIKDGSQGEDEESSKASPGLNPNEQSFRELEAYKTEVANDNERNKLETVQNTIIEMPVLNIKDLLISRFL
jgi:hypothetical protein